jgi:hypothetical protein
MNIYSSRNNGIFYGEYWSIITALIIPQIKIDFIIAENYAVTLSGTVERINIEKGEQCDYPAEINEKAYRQIIHNMDMPVLLFTSSEDKITTYEDSKIMEKNPNQLKILFT